MQSNKLIRRLSQVLPAEQILLNERMDRHTTFRIGGPADLLLLPHSEQECIGCIELLKQAQMPYEVIGNGSNILVKDGGVRGCIIQLIDGEHGMQVDAQAHTIYAYAGVALMPFALRCAEAGLGGCEFASGIPGTIGGAIFMNAGAYGHEMKDIVQTVRVMDSDGNIFTLSNQEMQFAYRDSRAHREHMIILGATFQLYPENKETVMAHIADFTKRRNDKQPLNYASAGSTFKRPEGYFAAKLIDDAGLKGAHVGNAEVSEKHAGFIVNKGGASARDVLDLIRNVQQSVKEQFDVQLHPEVRILGED